MDAQPFIATGGHHPLVANHQSCLPTATNKYNRLSHEKCVAIPITAHMIHTYILAHMSMYTYHTSSVKILLFDYDNGLWFVQIETEIRMGIPIK